MLVVITETKVTQVTSLYVANGGRGVSKIVELLPLSLRFTGENVMRVLYVERGRITPNRGRVKLGSSQR